MKSSGVVRRGQVGQDLSYNQAARPPRGRVIRFFLIVCLAVVSLSALEVMADQPPGVSLTWSQLPPLPDELGVAGPLVGVHNDALVVAGGANFPRPVWDNDKAWHDSIHVLVRRGENYVWTDGGRLPRPTAYGAAVSTAEGIVCMGGNDAEETFDDVYLLQLDPVSGKVSTTELPSLPRPCAFGSAARLGDVIYLAGGQSGQSLETAMNNFWSLDLSKRADPAAFTWLQRQPIPGPTRALNITVAQHDDDHQAVYVISGRRQQANNVQFLKDVWQFTPATDQWQRRADVPRSVMAGVGIDNGQSHVLVLGGADGTLFHQADSLRDRHPGFPKQALAYDTTTDTWTSAGPIPQNHVTTIAVKWNDWIIVPSGEVRPRVRSPRVWRVRRPGDRD